MKRTSRRIFAGLAGSYELSVDFATLFQDRRWKNWVLERVDGQGGLTLDVGCGTLLLEGRGRKVGREYVGVDLSMEMLEVGMTKNLDNVPLVVNGDAESLPFPDRAFDSVISCYVAKYVRTRDLARELARVTRPEGVAALYDFARPRGALAPVLELYIQGGLRLAGLLLGMAKRSSAFTYAKLPGIIESSAWDEEIEREMEASGFETLAVERLTGGAVLAYFGRRRDSP